MKKFLRISAALGAVLVTVVALLYVYLNWHGGRVWEAEEARLRALGEPLTIAEIEPAPIPDSLNFAAAPVFAEVFEKPAEDGRIGEISDYRGAFKKDSSAMAGFARSIDPNFAGNDQEAARVVLEEAERAEAVWDDVRAAAERPGTVWPVDYGQGVAMPIPHLAPMLRLAQSLDAQARARLILDDPAGALADVELILNLAGRMRELRLLICQLVQISLLSIAVGVIADGIERGAWSDGELSRIQALLTSIDLVGEMQETLRGERVAVLLVMTNMTAETLRNWFGMADAPPTASLRITQALWRARPRGLMAEDRALLTDLTQRMIDGLADPATLPQVLNEIDEDVEMMRSSPVQLYRAPIALVGVAAIIPCLRRAIYGQTRVDQAIVASGIERYRLRKGRLPETLQELVPQFLPEMPLDLLAGDTMRYRRLGQREFLLYGVGWNQRDEGGSSAKPSRVGWTEADDWVWGAESAGK